MKNEWNHLSPNGMATNAHPEFGGIIDRTIVDEKWFVIPNDDRIQSAEGFSSKEEAFEYLKQEICHLAKFESGY